MLLTSNSQSTSNATTVEIALPNKTDYAFFEENHFIKSLTVEYQNTRPVSISVFHRSSENQFGIADEFYDLGFAGDRYLLKKKYRTVDLLDYPKVGIINGSIVIRPTEYQYKITEFIDIDSIRYQFIIQQKTENEISIWETSRPEATFRGGNEKLAALFKNCCDSLRIDKLLSKDSVFLFRGQIDRDGSIDSVQLTFGKKSDLSKSIKKCIEETSGKWYPQIQGGRPVKSFVDIFIDIDMSHNVSISSSGWNRF